MATNIYENGTLDPIALLCFAVELALVALADAVAVDAATSPCQILDIFATVA